MSSVRPEFGPTLSELLGPRVRALPRAAQLALVVLGVAVLVLIGSRLTNDERTARNDIVVRDVDRPFTMGYDDRLKRIDPAAGEAVALGAEGLRLSVSELALPAYRGDSAGFLPTYFEVPVKRDMAQQYPGFAVRQEGRANVNRQQGYQVYFQFRRDGELWYGRRLVLLPEKEPTSRQAADITLIARRTPAIARPDSVGQNGPLKVALRSFRFGTERP